MLLSELARSHEITLVGLCWDDGDRQAFADWSAAGLNVRAIPHGPRSWAPLAYRAIQQPLQQIVSTSPALAHEVRSIVAGARAASRPFDVLHVEHLRGAAATGLPARLGLWTVFDAVDCISELARLTRLQGPGRLTRLVARREERPTRRLERAITAAADVTTVVAVRDALALRELAPTACIEVVSNGVTCPPTRTALTDEPIVIFTGKLSYHANQAAIRWFLDAIWPQVQTSVPAARLVIAGADPPTWLRARQRSQQVTVIANPPDMQRHIAEARVAVAPMAYGVGIQNKILEAMACGVPVVATRAATEGLLTGGRRALHEAADGRQFAASVIRLLTDSERARGIGQSGYDYVTTYHSWRVTAARFETLYVPATVVRRAA
jgi:glycosyltransferase involved in cell wall biosynthesis